MLGYFDLFIVIITTLEIKVLLLNFFELHKIYINNFHINNILKIVILIKNNF